MLSCSEVWDALPGVEAGERASGALRDHLATCEACRAEAERLREDLSVLRRDLAALAPSPFLEDAVVDAAHTTQPEGGPSRRGLWLRAGMALAAACLLVAVLLVTRNGENGGNGADDLGVGPGEESGPAPLVWFPPSAGEVVAARAANPPNFDYGATEDGPVLYRHWYRNMGRGLTTFAQEAIEPPVTGLAHRWVFAQGEQGDRALGMVGVPPRGVQVLGKGILDRVGGEQAMTGFKEYMGEAGTKVAEIQVSAPAGGGATARIEVILRPDYDGTLLLEEPLARALGLYQYEIPGTCRIDGDLSTAAHRARARLVIKRSAWDPMTKEPRDLPDFDEVVEVQVRVAGDPPPAAPLPRVALPGTTLRFEGERPHGYVTAKSMRIDAHSVELLGEVLLAEMEMVAAPGSGKRFVDVPVEGVGPLLVALEYHEGAHPACRVLLPHLDRMTEWPRGFRFGLERVTLSEKYESGAQVIVGRVWRGGTAIPSRESVALTTVAADGTVSFVRQAGEAGDDLRMSVRPKQGEPRWVDVNLRRRRLVINLMANGEVAVRGLAFQLLDEQGGGSAEALRALQLHLARLAGALGRRDERGRSDLMVLIHAERKVPWKAIQWVMQTCAHPDVRIVRLSFQAIGRADAPIPNDLPEDTGLGAPGLLVEAMRVVLLHKDGVTRFATRGGPVLIEGAVGGPGSALAALREGMRRVLASMGGGDPRIVLSTPPSGARVPYADVVAVLQALKDAGAGNILFEGAAMPR